MTALFTKRCAVDLDRPERVSVRFMMLLFALGLVSCAAPAATYWEDFSSDPQQRGWRIFGDSTLFRWNGEERHLDVTWDSTRPNSYFYRVLPTILSKEDDFALGFDLRLLEVAVGVKPGQPYTFQIALGFIHRETAMAAEFRRGSGTQSPNLVEFDYFPDSGFGATISPVMVSTNSRFIPSFSFPLELSRDARFRVQMRYTAVDRTLRTAMTRDGEPFGPIKDVILPATFSDFRVDAFSINSFNDTGSGGSIRARGVVDNILLETPDSPAEVIAGRFLNGVWQVDFRSRTGWTYALERSEMLDDWSIISGPVTGTGEILTLQDRGVGALGAPPPATHHFYRLRANRP